MKIVIECQRLFRRKKHGMEIVAIEILKALQKSGSIHELIVAAKKDEDNINILSEGPIQIKELASAPYPIWEQITLPRFSKKIKADLLHCTANTAPIFSKTPLIITIHDVIYMTDVSFGGSAYQNFGNLYRKWLVPKVAKKARKIITVSDFEKKEIIRILKIAPSKISVIHNGVNPAFTLIKDGNLLETIKNKYGLPSKFILHIGNTSPRKNTKGVLISYRKYLQNNQQALPLVISGCEEGFILSILKKINDEALLNQIIVLDYLPFDDLPVLYNLAEIFLYPSFREGFGMPVAEAMACGTPVITANNSSLVEVANGAAILVDADNTDEMAEAIQALANDKGKRTALIEKGVENAKRFTWAKTAAKTLEIYNEVL
ncbi:MAG: glycosyltransferase family 4 protein [Bacteroidetes bacterium]|nr:glycosyltransferase family 4 protein [Bacteroidota bacterium]